MRQPVISFCAVASMSEFAKMMMSAYQEGYKGADKKNAGDVNKK